MKKDGKDHSQAAAIRETFQKTFGASAGPSSHTDKSKDKAHRVIRQANGFRYAVVDIDANKGDELYDLLVDNGFNNFVFLNNLTDHPLLSVQPTKNESPLKVPQLPREQAPAPNADVQRSAERCSSPLFEIAKEEVTDETPFFEEVSATDLLGVAGELHQKQPVYSTEVVTLDDSRSPSPVVVDKAEYEKDDVVMPFRSLNESTTDDSDAECIAIEPVNKPKSKTASKGNSVNCLLCKNTIMVSRFTNLTNHARRHAVVKKYRCPHCALQHNEHARVRAHMISVHFDETSDVIDNSTPENIKLWNYLVRQCFPHYLTNHNVERRKVVNEDNAGDGCEKEYKCTDCGEKFLGPVSLYGDGSALLTIIETHLRSAHSVHCVESVCLVCGYQHVDQWNVRWHLSVRHPGLPPEKSIVVLPKSDYLELVTKFFPSVVGFASAKLKPNVNPNRGEARTSSSQSKAPQDESLRISDVEVSDIEQDGNFSSTSLPCRIDDLPGIATHAKAHYIIKQYECERCGYGSNNRSAISQHIYLKHRRGLVQVVTHSGDTIRKAWTQVVRACFPSLAIKLMNKKQELTQPVPAKKARVVTEE